MLDLEIQQHQQQKIIIFKNYFINELKLPKEKQYLYLPSYAEDDYKNTKKKIFNHHTSKDTAILNESNFDSCNLTTDIKSTKLYFNSKSNYFKDNTIYIDNKPVLNTNDIILKGTHNYENILCLLVLLKVINIDFKYALEVLKEFKGVEHRIEFVRTLKGVSYYNDSKSTNPTSTITALKSFDGNIHLILGGMERSQDFEDLTPYLSKIKKIYAIGEIRDRLLNFANNHNIPCEKYEFLKEALESIKNNVTSNDIVLLSPGSASWDQYQKFEDRGNEFKQIVNNF